MSIFKRKACNSGSVKTVGREPAGNGIRETVTCENRGTRPAKEPVLVFLRDECASLPQPVRKLAAIGRVRLAPGESKTVALAVPEEQLAFTDASLLKTLEPGWFRILCGGLEARVYAR